MIGTTTIAIHKSIERFESGHWAEKKLVAFGATNEVVVCSLRPIGVVLKVQRPKICRSKSVPYLDFGFGLSPGR